MTIIELYDYDDGCVVGYVEAPDHDVEHIAQQFLLDGWGARIAAPISVGAMRQVLQARRAAHRRRQCKGIPPLADTLFATPPLFAALQRPKGASGDPNDL